MLGIGSTRRGVFSVGSALAAGGLVVLSAAPARAHFILDAPPAWQTNTDASGSPQKNGPCAATPNTGLGEPATLGTPTGIVTAVQAGSNIAVTVTPTVVHPGWYRVSLVQGSSVSQTLVTLPDPAQTVSTCTPTKVTNPVWSSTQPVIADDLLGGATAIANVAQTFMVPIPANVTCTNANPCTLQVVMIMTDHPATDCYYHHCADISTGSGPADAGRDGAGSSSSSSSGSSSSSSSSGAAGSSSSSSSSGAAGSSSSSGAAGSSSSSSSSGAAGSSSSSSGSGSSSSGSSGAAGSSSSSSGAGTGSSSGAPAEGEDGGASASSDGGSSSGGCGLAVGGGSPAAAGAAGFLLLAMARRRRRSRSS
jgi:hypothetical protein